MGKLMLLCVHRMELHSPPKHEFQAALETDEYLSIPDSNKATSRILNPVALIHSMRSLSRRLFYWCVIRSSREFEEILRLAEPPSLVSDHTSFQRLGGPANSGPSHPSSYIAKGQLKLFPGRASDKYTTDTLHAEGVVGYLNVARRR